MFRKVVSGGQTGADIAGLRAASKYGLATGGWMPRGFRAEDGLHPEFAEAYGMQETLTEDYVERTLINARDSDGTLRIASNMKSPGEKCTLKGIKMFGKPYFDVDPTEIHPVHPEEVAEWIRDEGIEVLNVAGNRESVAPGIERYAEAFLTQVFRILDSGGRLERRVSDSV